MKNLTELKEAVEKAEKCSSRIIGMDEFMSIEGLSIIKEKGRLSENSKVNFESGGRTS